MPEHVERRGKRAEDCDYYHAAPNHINATHLPHAFAALRLENRQSDISPEQQLLHNSSIAYLNLIYSSLLFWSTTDSKPLLMSHVRPTIWVLFLISGDARRIAMSSLTVSSILPWHMSSVRRLRFKRGNTYDLVISPNLDASMESFSSGASSIKAFLIVES